MVTPLNKRRIEITEMYFIWKDAFIRCLLAHERRGVAVLNGTYRTWSHVSLIGELIHLLKFIHNIFYPYYHFLREDFDG